MCIACIIVVVIAISVDASRVGGRDLMVGALVVKLGETTIAAWVPPQVSRLPFGRSLVGCFATPWAHV